MENKQTELKYLYDKAIGDLVKCSLRIKELEAENRRLVALNDTFPPEIARLEDRVSEEYEAERADDRARIKELEAERDADRKREYGYSQQFDCIISIFHGLSSIFFESRDFQLYLPGTKGVESRMVKESGESHEGGKP